MTKPAWSSNLILALGFWMGFTSRTQAENGFMTFYGPATGGDAATDSGSCGFGALDNSSWPNGRFVSLGSNNSLVQSIGANKQGCGQCIQAQCTGTGCLQPADPTILYVTDSCDCLKTQLNVPRQVFLKYFAQSVSLGQVNVTFKQVDCNPPANITVKVLQSRTDTGNYIAFVLLNVAGNGGLLGVDLRSADNSTWRSVFNTYGNVWEGSNLGTPPYDLRLTAFNKDPLILTNAIPRLVTGSFPTNGQFTNSTNNPPSVSPGNAPPAAPPSLNLVSGPPLVQAPSTTSIVVPSQNVPSITLSGQRIDVPLYFAPPDSSLLGGYPNIKFTFTNCNSQAATVNLTIDRLQAPSQSGSNFPSWSLHTVDYRPIFQVKNDIIYNLVDYSFFNLETGEFAQLVEPAYVTFTNTSYDGTTVAVQNPQTGRTIFPRYLNTSLTNSAGVFSYSLLLPPGPNEEPTAVYLSALKSIFYYLTVLTLGNDGSSVTSPTCGPGYPAIAPWADYLRVTLAQLAPDSKINGNYYSGVPVGQIFSFQSRSLLISNAIIVGDLINSTSQLSASDCGENCRAFSKANPSTLCRAFTWCGALVGCGATSYQQCELRASTSTQNITTEDGLLNFASNSSIRVTSGSLILPPPTGLPALGQNPNSQSATTSSSPRSGL